MKATRTKFEPHSDAWFAARLGKFTASKAYLLMQNGRNKADIFSKSAETYILQTVAEIITDLPPIQVSAPALQWGRDYENSARELLQDRTGQKFETGYCYEIEELCFGSPDGENANALAEIKCPYSQSGHIENLLLEDWKELAAKCPDYYWQMQMNLMLSGRETCYFVSYDPRMKIAQRLRIMEVPAWPPNIEMLLERLEKANKLKDEFLKRIAKIK